MTCRACRSAEVEWVAVEPRGTLFTYTIVGRPTAKGFSSTPYTVGFVALDVVPNVRIIGNVVDVDPSAVTMGCLSPVALSRPGQRGDDPDPLVADVDRRLTIVSA
jgi:uncharacterized OB-fold protein